ncbi:hypothetical protein [Thalassobacillus sp. CUG 92003]|uniref:hypothetical protein n=1 Tax=Thalassobacillus sp. CUG 92003 TaxID=2736641 RepID=UPI0015E74F91|nr:hypothetical protein [Thalassobacillus sp. CUG 92003]
MKSIYELLSEGYGEDVKQNEGKPVQYEYEEEKTVLDDEDKQLLKMEEDGEPLSAMLQMRIGFLKRKIAEEEGKDDDHGNPDNVGG